MTKKHFIALADLIKTHRNVFTEGSIEYLAHFCYNQNSRFSYDRWIAYINGECGPNGGRVKR